MTAAPPSLARELAAAMDWWRDAGVDLDFVDDATAWLREDELGEPEPASPETTERSRAPLDSAPKENVATPVASVERMNLLSDAPPASLEEFRRFWLEAPGLDAIGPRGRVAPRGAEEADLMVLVVDPEQGDAEKLMSGPQGLLLDKMLAAMNVAEDKAYIASALPRHTPMADTAAIAAGGMDEVLALHITLAKPKRILALGRGILPLIGHDRAQDHSSLREIHHGGATTPLLVSEGLDSMMSMPRLKARFWRRWIEWSG
ncbi:hypothetical protein [Erythrobacter sp. THAF29]|uniref:hypothetical protein n=1 Tax=Erythrobacter sp. THAF29 TaxID=2587851 RepID=UPI0012695440|nr:hypothetical protein [Erythrobacter sp. THAF29]QFT78046.1 hypothetical protein FIU90_10905 [Erythrobacter sp. THAF29]